MALAYERFEGLSRSGKVVAKKEALCQAHSSSSRPTDSSQGSSPTRGSEFLVDFVETNEPRLIAFNEYVNNDGTEVAVVQVHPDADSMAFHMEVIADRAAAAYSETVDETTSIQVFGMASNAVLEMLERQAGVGVPLTVKSSHLGGFTRGSG